MADNEQAAEGGKREPRTIERRRTAGYSATYAENVNVELSLFDFRITVGEIVEVTEDRAVFEDRLSIILSPPHAKVFTALMATNLKKYEAEFGEIKLPEDMFPRKAGKKTVKTEEPESAKAEEPKKA